MLIYDFILDKKLSFLYKTLETNQYIILTNYKTYPQNMLIWLDKFRYKNFISNFSDRNIEDFAEILCNYEMVFFHATKLLPHEIDNIKIKGLISASKELYENKITQAFKNGYLLKNDYEKLILGNIWEKENRRNKVFTFINPDNIVHNSLNYYLYNYWGGEIINQNKNWRKFKVLNNIGIPCIITIKYSLSLLRKNSDSCFKEILKKIIYEYNNKDSVPSLVDVDVNIPTNTPISILYIHPLYLTKID